MKNHLDDLGAQTRQAPPGPPPTREWIEGRRSQRRRHRWLAAASGLLVLGLATVAVLASTSNNDPARTEAVESSPQPTARSSTTSSSTSTPEPEAEAPGSAEAPLEDRIADLETELRAWSADSGTAGFSMAVVSSGGVVHRADGGFADRDGELPVTADTLFHAGAMQRSMNALLIATLVEDAVLEWDTPVVDLVSDTGIDPDITIRHLLTGTAGVALDADRQLPTGEIGSDEVGPAIFSAVAREANRSAEPGAKFVLDDVSPAAAGYAAAGAAANGGENVHQAYLRLFSERVLEPLGMSDSTLLASEARASGNLSKSYSIIGREVLTSDREVDILAPESALKSNTNDLGQYLQMLLNDGVTQAGETLVSPESIEIMTEPALGDPVLGDYAMGWFHGVNRNGVTVLSHAGFFDGFVGAIFLAPESDLGLVVLTNSASDERGLFDRVNVFVDSI